VLANSNLDDPLENAEQLADQMESLPFIFRFEYEDMNTYFCSLMDPIVTAYSRGLAPGIAFVLIPAWTLQTFMWLHSPLFALDKDVNDVVGCSCCYDHGVLEHVRLKL